MWKSNSKIKSEFEGSKFKLGCKDWRSSQELSWTDATIVGFFCFSIDFVPESMLLSFYNQFKYLLSSQGDTKVFETWLKRWGKWTSRKKSSLNHSNQKCCRRLRVRFLPVWKGAWVNGESGKGTEIKIDFSLDCGRLSVWAILLSLFFSVFGLNLPVVLRLVECAFLYLPAFLF